ncbi:hypothetical protein TWF281_002959 [Arthrobotrys megalospora]
MKPVTALLLLGVAAYVDAAQPLKCDRDNCFRGLLGKKFTKECLSYASALKIAKPTFTSSKQIVQTKHVTITPKVVLYTTTLGEAATITETESSTTTVTVQEKPAATKVKRGNVAIPSYVYSVCASDTDRRFLSACSCILPELTRGASMPAVATQCATVTNTVTKYITTTLPAPTSTVTITPKATKTVTDVTTVTETAKAEVKEEATFKIKFKGGIHDGRYLFPGPIFEEQPGIFYSMFTPNRGDALDFKLTSDGVISSVTGGMNLTYSLDFDDGSLYPAEKEGDPPIKVPSFVFLMAAEAQAIPEYRASPIKCEVATGDVFNCQAGAEKERTETGWYAFGIDETSYIPTLGLGKPGYNWMYWPGQKVTLGPEWNK